MLKNLAALLAKFSNAHGLSGYEDAVAEAVRLEPAARAHARAQDDEAHRGDGDADDHEDEDHRDAGQGSAPVDVAGAPSRPFGRTGL